MAEFHETRMGQQFYDKTIPALVKALERIAAALEQDTAGTQPRGPEQQAHS